MKQKVNKLTFNTACSLACISIVACIVKEGSMNSDNIPLPRIESTFQVVVSGCIISVACCYFIWPVSAVKKLQKTLNDSYDIFSQVISILVRRFVAGEQFTPVDIEMIEKLKLISNHYPNISKKQNTNCMWLGKRGMAIP